MEGVMLFVNYLIKIYFLCFSLLARIIFKINSFFFWGGEENNFASHKVLGRIFCTLPE